jgi:hypothetical protein
MESSSKNGISIGSAGSTSILKFRREISLEPHFQHSIVFHFETTLKDYMYDAEPPPNIQAFRDLAEYIAKQPSLT